MDFDLNSLNQEQLAPVLDTEGAILVTAGAGSGKTRLLTHRIAYLLSKGVSPFEILAITFTNKAANEMAERLNQMADDGSYVWVSTFHSMCARILRRYAPFLGYTKSFSIYGDAERDKLIASAAIEVDEENDDLKKQALYHISNAKNLGLAPELYQVDFAYISNIEHICKVYSIYEHKLKANNAMDFDDLLLKTRQLLVECKEAFDYYTDKFRYIHVDEFQDTNSIQYELIKLLSAKYRNVLAVGDEDQCIYGWRGANILNINNFIKDFNCKIYKLEQNYRSTKKILDLANKLISKNTSRIEKKLWTNNESGDSIQLYVANGDSDEADFVCRTIYALHCNKYNLSDIAVLMRINALTRPFEQRLMQYGIAHKVYGGFKFYDRKEIKDLLAYFRILANHFDSEAITRVINFPRRGIGTSTVAALSSSAALSGKSLYEVIADIENTSLSSAIKKKVGSFATVIKCLEDNKDKLALDDLMRYLVRLLDLKTLYGENTEENADRKANIGELINSIKEYVVSNPGATLDDYMQTVTLWSDLDDAPSSDCVNLATVHSAKGLEYKVVFIVGMEEGVFPISRADNKAELEEERRLFYVAITRAKEKLFITRARSRYMYGQIKDCVPSRFLMEAELEHIAARRSFDSATKGYYKDEGFDDESSKVRTSQYVRNDNVPKKQNDGGGFYVGEKVRHKKFGSGTIISMSGIGISLSAVIEFEGYGRMNIAVAYAPITHEGG